MVGLGAWSLNGASSPGVARERAPSRVTRSLAAHSSLHSQASNCPRQSRRATALPLAAAASPASAVASLPFVGKMKSASIRSRDLLVGKSTPDTPTCTSVCTSHYSVYSQLPIEHSARVHLKDKILMLLLLRCSSPTLSAYAATCMNAVTRSYDSRLCRWHPCE